MDSCNYASAKDMLLCILAPKSPPMPDINQVKQWTVSRPFVWEAKCKTFHFSQRCQFRCSTVIQPKHSKNILFWLNKKIY